MMNNRFVHRAVTSFSVCLQVLFVVLVLDVALFAQSSGPTLSPSDDFAARCKSPNVVRCIAFDSAVPTGEYSDPGLDAAKNRKGVLQGYDTIAIDTAQKSGGAGSLRFTVPARASANSSGEFHANFSAGLTKSFGEGTEFYVQWRERFDSAYLQNQYLIGSKCREDDDRKQLTVADCPGDSLNGGMKQAIIGPQDTDLRNSQFGKHFSCETPHLVITLEGYHDVPEMYHSCGTYEAFLPQFVRSGGGIGYLVESALPCDTTRRGAVGGEKGKPPCFLYQPDQWMTFQLHVKVGHWYLNPKEHIYHHDSLVELWIAPEGKPSVLVHSMVMYDLRNDARSSAQQPGAPYAYGKVWFLPYNTARDPNAGPYPEAHTWYDDLIVSTTRVPDPGVNTPNAPDSLNATALNDSLSGRHTSVKLQWRINPPTQGRPAETGFRIERCTGQLYDCNAADLAGKKWEEIAKVAAGANSYIDKTADASAIYTYRVRAFNQFGDSAYTSSTVNAPQPASDLKASVAEDGVHLSWTDNSDDETAFSVERCSGIFEYVKTNGTAAQSPHHDLCLDRPLEEGGREQEPFRQIASVPASDGTGKTVIYVDNTAKRNVTYSYRVRALNGAGTPRVWDFTPTRDHNGLAYTNNITIHTQP